MAGVCVAVVAFHVISLFTLLYKTAKKGGVTPWYGFVLGGSFYMIFIMIGQGLFAGAFHPNFAAIHDYQVSQNNPGIYGKTESDRSKALEGLSYTSAALFTVFVSDFVALPGHDLRCDSTTGSGIGAAAGRVVDAVKVKEGCVSRHAAERRRGGLRAIRWWKWARVAAEDRRLDSAPIDLPRLSRRRSL